MVPVADYDHATAEAREIASRLKLAEDEVRVAQNDGSVVHISACLLQPMDLRRRVCPETGGTSKGQPGRDDAKTGGL